MTSIRSFLAATAAVAVTSGIALAPTLSSAAPASAAVSCNSTSLIFGINSFRVRVPTVGTGTGNDNCLLGPGNDSTAVARLQISLNACDLPALGVPPLTVDGIYGTKTEQAVQAVQGLYGLPKDGVYGPNTRNVMFWKYQAGFCERLST
jgi:peptidoglycan hydrolase-like protein with peptidoglycan-binding domain